MSIRQSMFDFFVILALDWVWRQDDSYAYWWYRTIIILFGCSAKHCSFI